MHTVIKADSQELRSFKVVLIMFLVIAAIVFGLRMRFERSHRRIFDFSDLVCFAALLLDIAHLGIVVGTFDHGSLEDSYLDLAYFLKLLFASRVVWILLGSIVRISTILIILRTSLSWLYKTGCWILLVLSLGILVSLFISMFSICQRLNSFFDFSEEVFECWRREDLLELWASILELCLNLATVVLSMQIPWNSCKERRNKIQLSLMISVGLIFICLSIPRIAFWAYRGDFLTSSAFTITLLITGLQPSFGIIYACILSLSSHSLPNTNEKKKPVRSSAGIKEDDSVPLPYLQIKAELDVEHQKYELEARQKSLHELDGQDARQELSAPAHQTMGNAPMIPELN